MISGTKILKSWSCLYRESILTLQDRVTLIMWTINNWKAWKVPNNQWKEGIENLNSICDYIKLIIFQMNEYVCPLIIDGVEWLEEMAWEESLLLQRKVNHWTRSRVLGRCSHTDPDFRFIIVHCPFLCSLCEVTYLFLLHANCCRIWSCYWNICITYSIQRSWNML